jgi:signal transduction histidine kinase
MSGIAAQEGDTSGGPIAAYAGRADLGPVVESLTRCKDDILERWLERVSREPFHLGRRERAVADHIPALFEAIVASLAQDAPERRDIHSPMESEAVQTAAREHGQARRTQGLSLTEVISEIRMLRQETSRALCADIEDAERASDVVAADLALHDGFDGAICIAAAAVMAGVEQEHRDALAITVHDLKTPLAALKGSAQLALRRSKADPAPPPAEIEDFLHRIVASSNRLRDIVDEALAAEQAADGEQLRLTPVAIEQFLLDIVSSLGAEARSRVRLVVEDNAAQASWDVQRLRRALENIISNALKYAPEGFIDISAMMAGDQIAISIRDRGIGLSADDKRKLFARYYRSPEAIRMKIEGTGLGLYVAKATVEAHGGTLHVESPGPGRGTTFHLLIPVKGEPSDGESKGH